MDSESLVWDLQDLTETRPWSLNRLLGFYFSLCCFLSVDPTTPITILPGIIKLIESYIEILSILRNMPLSPEQCTSVEDLELFHASLTPRYLAFYGSRCEKRMEEIRASDLMIEEMLSSQYDKPIIDFLREQDEVMDDFLISQLYDGYESLTYSPETDVPMEEYIERGSAQFMGEFLNDLGHQLGGGGEVCGEEGRGEEGREAEGRGEEGEDDRREVMSPIGLINNCEILGQNETEFPKFGIRGLEITVKLTNDISEGIEAVTEAVLKDVAPHDYAQIILRSVVLDAHRPDIELSFKRRDQIDVGLLFEQIEEILYDDQMEQFFLNPVTIIYSIVRLPHGHGRPKSKNAQTFEVFSRNRRGICTIHSNDKICLARAISVGIAHQKHTSDKLNVAYKKAYDKISHCKVANPTQKAAAVDLCVKAGVSIAECGSAESFRKFQAYLHQYSLMVFQMRNNAPVLVLCSNDVDDDRPRIALLNESNHYNLITKLKPLFGRERFCEKCLLSYKYVYSHKCQDYCFSCQRSIICEGLTRKCHDCQRSFTGDACFATHKSAIAGKLPLCERLYHCGGCLKLINTDKRTKSIHECGEMYCFSCATFRPSNHLCYIKVIKDAPEGPPSKKALKNVPQRMMVFFDFECQQTRKHDDKPRCYVHEAVLCMAESCCDACLDDVEGSRCPRCGPRKHSFLGSNCVKDFFAYLRTLHQVKNVTLLSHNGSNYDHQLLLQTIMEADDTFSPDVIINGTRILQIKLFNLTFLDSYCFMPIPLSKFATTFELGDEFQKGHFPHFVLNCVPNNFDASNPHETNLILPSLPPTEAYGIDNFSAKDNASFLKWHEEESALQNEFNFVDSLKLYCSDDVHILASGALRFRRIFLELCDVDPFQIGVTIASVCSVVLRKMFLKKDTIGLIPTRGYRLFENQSREALEWLWWEGHRTGTEINSALNGKEEKILKMKVDGKAGNTIYQYAGCIWHGCKTCYGVGINRNQLLHGNPYDTLNVRFNNTMKIHNRLKELGYDVIELWGCEWSKQKADNPEIKEFLENSNFAQKYQNPLNPRDSFFGGRVSTLKTYCKVEGPGKIFYVDICSLYPFINKTGKIPIGHPEILLENIPAVSDFEGLLKCDVLPPTNLYHPVLPYRTKKGKLVFTLCRSCCEIRWQGDCDHSDDERLLSGTWVIDELRKAEQRGYVIKTKYEAWKYEVTQYDKETDTGGVFKDYVNCFLKSKQESSGWPPGCVSQEEKAAYIAAYKAAEGITLDPLKIKKNEGLRAISKLLLNSMWGKLGQRSLVTKTEIIKEPKSFFELLQNPEVEIKSVLTVTDEALLVKWVPCQEAEVPLKHTNSVCASFTTCQARLVLLEYMEQVGALNIYQDTDSICYYSPSGEPLIKTGPFLGEMTCELTPTYGPGAYISEFVSAGPKNYSFWVESPSTGKRFSVTKCKGFRINCTNQSIINGDNLKAMLGVGLDNPVEPFKVDLPRQIRRLPDHTLVSVDLFKTYRVLVDKVRVLPNYETVPYGHKITTV